MCLISAVIHGILHHAVALSGIGKIQIGLQDESPEESASSHLDHLVSASLIKAAPKQDVAPAHIQESTIKTPLMPSLDKSTNYSCDWNCHVAPVSVLHLWTLLSCQPGILSWMLLQRCPVINTLCCLLSSCCAAFSPATLLSLLCFYCTWDLHVWLIVVILLLILCQFANFTSGQGLQRNIGGKNWFKQEFRNVFVQP